MLDFIVLFLSVGIPLSSALLLASLGETVNQRSGVFNLGCEGVIARSVYFYPELFCYVITNFVFVHHHRIFRTPIV